eukprot:13065735-Heterocapsa_arctica.AAC.1
MKEKTGMLQKSLEDGRGQLQQFRANARTSAKIWRMRKRRNAEEECLAQEAAKVVQEHVELISEGVLLIFLRRCRS